MFEKCSVRSNRSLLGNVECAATREREREMRWMAGNTRPELSSNAAAAVAGEVINVWPGKENRREKGRKANPADQKATATTSTIIEKKDH